MSHFNPTQPIKLDIDGRQFIVRFPTDEQLVRLWHSRHYLKTDSRGKKHTQLCCSNEFDKGLLRDILVEGPKPSRSESRQILDILDFAATNVTGSEGELCRVTLTTKFGPPFLLTHQCRFPTSEELIASEHAAENTTTRQSRGKHMVVRLSPIWAPHFYNLWAVQPEGYDGAVPLSHQVRAVLALQKFVRECFPQFAQEAS